MSAPRLTPEVSKGFHFENEYMDEMVFATLLILLKDAWDEVISEVDLIQVLYDGVADPMNKTDLRDKSQISTASLAKLGRNENLTTAVLLKICNALDCDISDIMEVIESEEQSHDNEIDKKR